MTSGDSPGNLNHIRPGEDFDQLKRFENPLRHLGMALIGPCLPKHHLFDRFKMPQHQGLRGGLALDVSPRLALANRLVHRNTHISAHPRCCPLRPIVAQVLIGFPLHLQGQLYTHRLRTGPSCATL